ncbi:LysR family transcriptional regulator [Reyranella sp. CPCC 100927]|uniref:LysR family transcriptional regulator n=1 Tax=Reyranella sp. CPCC 100927 TaxID=2599616 RepID=UPI0011B3F175|nr:LysR family transcriptional regulator [Reyranella sp. CPCC 100927]TWT02841.1 LysR family transcriptional regulator [Reyranella sp. CPCC 100927]
MKWRFEDVLTFLQVMESGGITAAATRLNVSKSVISKRIADLEAALGVELFQRSTRHLRPSESGEAFHESIRPLVQQINDAVERIGSRPQALQGRLRITAPMTFGTMYLGSVIFEFAKRHPDLELALDYDDRMVDLVRGGYDVGVRIGILKESSLVARKLCTVHRAICCSPAYARDRGLPATVAELAAHDCIDYANVNAGTLWQFAARKPGGKPLSVALRSRIAANNGEAMRDAAIAGLGLALMPMFLAAAPLRDGRLIRVLPDETPPPYAIHAVYPPTRHVSAKVRAFVDHLIASFRSPPPWEREGT